MSLTFFPPTAAKADKVVLAADPWCPYNCKPGMQQPGILIEVAREALAAAGHKMVYRNLPWARAISMARGGKIDGIVGAGREEVPDFVFAENGILSVTHSFFVRPDDDWGYEGLESLHERRLGVINGYSYGDLHWAYVTEKNIEAHRVYVVSGRSPLGRLARMLEVNRVDTIVEEARVLRYTMRGKSFRPRRAGDYASEDVHIAFSPENPASADYARALNDFVTADGGRRVEEIIKRYLK